MSLFNLLICLCLGYHLQALSETLSEQASNPITQLSQLQFESDYSPVNFRAKGPSNTFTIKPIIALDKTDRFPLEQLIRIKFQVPSLPYSSSTKAGTRLGDTQAFNLFITEEDWGRWGIGPMAIFPTASKSDAGQGKWQLGPAVGLSILKFPHLQMGFLAQNPISFAGRSSSPKRNYLIFQPFMTYHFFKNSYVVFNPEWTVDWLHHIRQIPLNFGFGHTFSKIDMSLQFEWMAYQNATSYVPRYTIQFCLNYLFN